MLIPHGDARVVADDPEAPVVPLDDMLALANALLSNDISKAVGHASDAAFCYAFKEYYGVSPRA